MAKANDKTRLQVILEEVADDLGGTVRSYSGRAMYGRECLGIDTDSSLGEIFAAVLESVEGEDDTRELQDAFRGMCSDSMGRGTIYYWPSLPYVGDDETDEDDDHDCEGPQCCSGDDPHAVARLAQFERSPQT